ncbi:hypothetical protein [Nostoc sp.]|uniref:hypothetical protein n=1 Tax=Nostoc sp. TaxID=1180 RepID=UPI002FF55A83
MSISKKIGRKYDVPNQPRDSRNSKVFLPFQQVGDKVPSATDVHQVVKDFIFKANKFDNFKKKLIRGKHEF